MPKIDPATVELKLKQILQRWSVRLGDGRVWLVWDAGEWQVYRAKRRGGNGAFVFGGDELFDALTFFEQEVDDAP